jgi:hypothetical protein
MVFRRAPAAAPTSFAPAHRWSVGYPTVNHALELLVAIGVHRTGGLWRKLMLRLLLLGLIGVAAYRIGKEMYQSIPSDFEPVPAPAGKTKRTQGRSKSGGGNVGDR